MDSSQSSSTPRHHPQRRRTFLSFRRNQIVSMDQTTDLDFQNLHHFHSLISSNLLSLLPSSSSSSSSSHLLSISFLSKLLQSLLSFQSHFQSLLHQSLISNPPLLSRPPLDRLLSDHLDSAVKSLDVLNSATQSLYSLRHSHRQADIAASALLRRPPNLIRAKAALAKLFTDDNHRATSFTHGFSFRSVDAGSGIALAVQNMNSILAFCMWALMAAFGVVGGPLKVEIEGLVGLQERIWEEVNKKKKKKMKKGRSGEVLLVELEEVERCGKALMEENEEEDDLGKKAMEFGEACESLGGGLVEFERLLREVFHRIFRGRVEVQHFLEQSSRAS